MAKTKLAAMGGTRLGVRPPDDATTRKLRTLVATFLGVMDEVEVSHDSHLVDDLGADSLDSVELIMIAEDEFKIQIPDEKADKVRTFGDFATLVATTLASAKK